MKIISDHFKILNCLTFNIYTIVELSNILSIPIFKIRRYISDIGYILKESEIEDIHQILIKNPLIIENIKELQCFTPEERKLYLVLSFLKKDTINLNQLSEEISVTRRTLANDVKDLKQELQKFHLTLNSLNSFGISLSGCERNKRHLFYIYLFKIIYKLQFLPKEFEKKIEIFKIVNNNYNFNKIIDKILKIGDIYYHPLSIKYLEIISFIAIIRKDFHLEVNNSSSYVIDKELLIYLKTISFYSNFEFEVIGTYCYHRKKERFFLQNNTIVEEINNMVASLNNILNVKIEITNKFLVRLIFIILIMKYKKEFNENDFYPFNNNVAENYLNEFSLISEFIKDYFISIDSFDLTIITIMIINKIHFDFEKKIENLDNIVIVYNILDETFLFNTCNELGLSKIIDNITFVPFYKLDEYLESNIVKGIISFENIKFNNNYNNVNYLKINLPITKLDKVKLSLFL